MNLSIKDIIKNAVLNVMSTHKEKINPLDQEPKTDVRVLMDQYDDLEEPKSKQ